MTERTVVIYIENNIKLSWLIGSGAIYDKNQIGNRMPDYTNAIYVKNDSELLWMIGSSTDYDENKIGQLCNWLNKYSIRRKQNWATMTGPTQNSLWRKPNRTTTNHTNVVYSKNETKVSCLIESGAICDENQIGQWRD